MNLLKNRKKIFYFALVCFVECLGIFLLTFAYAQAKSYISYNPPVIIQGSLPTYTKGDLTKFNGTDSAKPIYLALDGYVYDVTKGKSFYIIGGDYHYLAGKDDSAPLHIFGGSLIKEKYHIVGIYKG